MIWLRQQWEWLKWAGVAFGALMVALFIRKSGKDSVRVKTMKDQLEDVKDANEIKREVADNYRAGKRPDRVRGKFDID